MWSFLYVFCVRDECSQKHHEVLSLSADLGQAAESQTVKPGRSQLFYFGSFETQHPKSKHWLTYILRESTILGLLQNGFPQGGVSMTRI